MSSQLVHQPVSGTTKGSAGASSVPSRERVMASGGYAAQVASLSPATQASTSVESSGTSPPPANTGWSSIVRRNFSAWDLNSDGYLGHSEVNTLLSSRSVTGQDAAALAALQAYIDGLEEASNDEFGDENDGVTLADVTAYERGQAANTNGADTKYTEGRYGAGQRNIRSADAVKRAHGGARATAHSNELFPNGSPTLSALQQGGMGDCYFLAALGSMIARNPQDVVNMITRNTRGSQVTGYTVDWPGSLGTVTVSPLTDGEIARFSNAGRDGLWLPILEKAYGMSRGGDQVNVGEEIGEGGQLAEGIDALSAKGTDTDMLSLTSLGTTRTKLSAAFGANPKIVTAALQNDDNEFKLPSGHAYSVIAWDGTWLTLRNPWGSNPRAVPARGDGFQNLSGGQFKMTLPTFDDVFFQIAYSE